jgi:hypothetical protein
VKKIIFAMLLALLVFPGVAEAREWLTGGEASRVIGRELHREYTNLWPGTLTTQCARQQAHIVVCNFVYGDRAGNPYCGRGRVREYRYRYLSVIREFRCPPAWIEHWKL